VGLDDTRINLTFHGLGPPPDSISASEKSVWVAEDAFIGILDELRSERSVRITFDDGNQSDLSTALPALLERDLAATFFVLAGRIGAPGYLDGGHIRELASAGMAIGVHGMDHRSWRGLSAAETEREMSDARRILEDLIGGPVDEASCPFGAYDREVLRNLRLRGYRRVFTSDRLPGHVGDWFQPRHTVHSGDVAAAIRGWIRNRGPSFEHVLRRTKVFLKKRRG